jgi:hypothetical protein
MSNKKQVFTIDTFPLDKLRLATFAKGCSSSDFGTVHQQMFLELQPGVLEEFILKIPPMQSNGFSYYIDAKGNNILDPKFYSHPQLNPHWSTKDANGTVTKKKSPTGEKVEAFLDRLKARIIELLKEFDQKELGRIVGTKLAKNIDDSTVEDIAQHPKFDKDHKYRPNEEDEDRSKTIALSLWTQDKTKKKSDDKNNKRGTDGEKKGSDVMAVPDTNTLVYTKFYIHPKKAVVTDYGLIKKFVYSPKNYANASNTQCSMISEMSLLSPSILWKPKDNVAGKIQFKISEMIIMSWNMRTYSRDLDDSKINQIEEDRKKAMAEFGFVQEEEEEEEKEEEVLDTNKRQKTSDTTHKSTWMNNDMTFDDQCDEEVYDEAYANGMEAYEAS